MPEYTYLNVADLPGADANLKTGPYPDRQNTDTAFQDIYEVLSFMEETHSKVSEITVLLLESIVFDGATIRLDGHWSGFSQNDMIPAITAGPLTFRMLRMTGDPEDLTNALEYDDGKMVFKMMFGESAISFDALAVKYIYPYADGQLLDGYRVMPFHALRLDQYGKYVHPLEISLAMKEKAHLVLH